MIKRFACLSSLLSLLFAANASARVIISGWDFQNVPIATNLNPPSDLGTVAGAATALGMNNTYPTPGPSTDISDIAASAGSSDPAGAANNAWRVRGGPNPTQAANGWSSLAPIGTQGAQFLVDTTGFTGIQLKFDLNTTAQAEANLEVLYTLDGTTWTNIPVTFTGTGATVKTNTTSTNTVNGSYIQFTGAAWFNQITADFTAIAGANNNPKFGVRLVNASTGADDLNAGGTAYNNSSGNWRYDEVQISGTPTLKLTAGNLLVSRSVYTLAGDVAALTVGSNLPDSASGTTPFKAVASGKYPNVFNNAAVDANFGVTSPIFLDQITTAGALVGTLGVPVDLVTTSFPSKSEIALNLSADGQTVTFMGYAAPIGALDVSNTNTPAIIEPGNFVTAAPTYRAVVQLDYNNNFQVTTTNAYAGNNGRAAAAANGLYYTTGNAGAGDGSALVTGATGVQLIVPGLNATSAAPGTQHIGSFDIAQNGFASDKTAKDNNFRGATIFNNTLYVTKGSGSNGINTVYQVGTAGTLPTPATAATAPITILPGFSMTLAKSTTGVTHPFGIWFANATTLYVADEGDGILADLTNGVDPTSGLQKWILVNGTWQLAYTLQTGLSLGVNYTVGDGQGNNYFPTATDGLRNLTGKANGDGTVTIYAVTSTVSGSGDQGADPNKLVAITDTLAFTTRTQAAGESFATLRSAAYGEVLRGVSFVPVAAAVSAPTITVQPVAAVTGTVGGNVTLAVAVTGSPAPTFQWRKNGTAIAGATNASLVLTNVQTGDAGSYTVAVTNATSSVTSSASTVSVTPPTLPAIASQPSGQAVTAGTPVTLTATVTGSPAPTLQWFKNGEPISGATDPSLAFVNPQITDTGSYVVVVTNQAGSVTSSPATIKVNSTTSSARTIISGWDFQNGAAATNLSPASDLGTVAGVASALGMNNTYPTPGPSMDISDITSSPGSSDPAGANNNGWRVRGGPNPTQAANGWSSLAPIGTQGAQFLVNTTGFSGVQVMFDLNTTAQAEANLEVLYTLDGTTWTNIPVSYSGPGAVIKVNSTSPNTVAGTYIQFSGAAWFNQITADFTGIPAAGNNPKFGVRFVNASTGADDINAGGTPYNNSSGNWRYDEVQFTGLSATATGAPRLVNFSALSQATAGNPAVQLSFVTAGKAAKPVLVRAVGPTLRTFGITAAAANPTLQLTQGTALVASNSAWASSADLVAATTAVGAFPLAAGSKDSALLGTLAPGGYSVLVALAAGDSGAVLTEVYDAAVNPPAGERLINGALRGNVGTGNNILTAGFVIVGSAPKTMLIRGLGPSLTAFGVAGAVADPKLQLFHSGSEIAANDNWGGDAVLAAASASAGAFTLPAASKDAALLLSLTPGAYTVQVSGVGGATGAGMLEVYELP